MIYNYFRYMYIYLLFIYFFNIFSKLLLTPKPLNILFKIKYQTVIRRTHYVNTLCIESFLIKKSIQMKLFLMYFSCSKINSIFKKMLIFFFNSHTIFINNTKTRYLKPIGLNVFNI